MGGAGDEQQEGLVERAPGGSVRKPLPRRGKTSFWHPAETPPSAPRMRPPRCRRLQPNPDALAVQPENPRPAPGASRRAIAHEMDVRTAGFRARLLTAGLNWMAVAYS